MSKPALTAACLALLFSFPVYSEESPIILSPPSDLNLLPSQTDLVFDWRSVSDSHWFWMHAAGDVNGDGLQDLLISSTGYKYQTGFAALYFGKESLDLSEPNWMVNGDKAGDSFGNLRCSSGVGDLNGDGYDDIVVGAAAADGGGMARVYYGSGAGALVAQTIRIAEQDFGGFGRACANQTDLNGDGFDDLVVSNGNKVYVFEGSKAGVSGQPDTVLHEENDDIYKGSGYGEWVKAGDFNGDGFDDLAVSYPFLKGVDGQDSVGAVYVYQGSSQGVSPNSVWQSIGKTSQWREGESVVTADLNSDGYDELIIGGGLCCSNIYMGSETGLHDKPVATVSGPYSAMLYALYAADLDGDGYEDLITTSSSNAYNDPYANFVVFGGANPEQFELRTLTAVTTWTRTHVLGDVDGDGFQEVAHRVDSDHWVIRSIIGTSDEDEDGVLDDSDNCPSTPNPDQADLDGDNIGDACDTDVDGDSVENTSDNCPLVANSDQLDVDGDLIGDACDDLIDNDADGIANDLDNCPAVPNADQADNDGDLQGDACDFDDDNDGVEDAVDNCSLTANEDQADNDSDNIGDVCDSDDDNDAIEDDLDNCPLIANVSQDDNDGDGFGDVCDPDDDNDAVDDSVDNCPLSFNPDQSNTDGVGAGDACNDAFDVDDDDWENDYDNCPNVANRNQSDFDYDNIGDACDSDVDGDEVANAADACELTPLGEFVGSIGCSIEQLCPCDAPRQSTDPWKNHGQYVSCMTKAAQSFAADGVISDNEKSDLVNAAAQSSCGY